MMIPLAYAPTPNMRRPFSKTIIRLSASGLPNFRVMRFLAASFAPHHSACRAADPIQKGMIFRV
jgi:hypothetical protein